MLLSNRVYDALKPIVQVVLPGLAALYFALAQIWHLPGAEEVVGTIAALDTFLGLLLGLSSKSYKNSDARFDGMLAVEDTQVGSRLRVQQLDPNALVTKNEVTFKVQQ